MAPGTGAPFELRIVPSIERLEEPPLEIDRLEEPPLEAIAGLVEGLPGFVSGGGAWAAAWPARVTANIDANTIAFSRLVPLFFVFFLFLFVGVVFILVEIEVFFFLFLVVFRAEFHRIDARDLQRSPTLIAGKDVSLIQFFFFHINGSVTFRTTDHKIIDLFARR
jgi:hypothetical protein